MIAEDRGVTLEHLTMADLGRATRVGLDQDHPAIVEGAGRSQAIEGLVQQIRTRIEETTADEDREQRQERVATLVGGVALIHVGAATEPEMKAKKARVEAALNATRAAVEEGVIPGGGVAFVRCLPALERLQLNGDEAVGALIVKRALEEPMRQLAENAGAEGSIVVHKVKEEKGAYGYNVATETYEDLMAAGVVDPTKVARSALQNASSLAALRLTTEALITELPAKNEKAPATHPGGGDDETWEGAASGVPRAPNPGGEVNND
jgi:chaperonin GroEL